MHSPLTTSELLHMEIDRTSLSEFLALVAKTCEEKAEHLRANWQDGFAAREWEKASSALVAISNMTNV